MTHNATNPVGRPLKFKTVEALDRAINAYFDLCDPHTQRQVVDCGINEKGETIWREREVMTEPKPYTVSGLARALGTSRETLLDYGSGKYDGKDATADDHEFSDSVRRAYDRCHEFAESQLYGKAQSGAAFSLKNNWGWRDRQELTGANGASLMPIGLDAAVLQRRTNGTAPPSPAPDSSESS